MTDDITQRLANVTLNLNRIVPILQIIFGTFGNVMNILIFIRRSLRNNPCSTYFLALSINNIFILYVALLTRLLASGWHIDPSQSNNILCKLRVFFVYITTCLTQWFIVLASIDRFLSSCRTVRYRQRSNKSTARKATIFTVIFITITHIHTLIGWSSEYVGSIAICNIFDRIYDIAFSIFYLLITCLIPPFLMIIFGLKTILNVREIRTHITPITNDGRSQRVRSKDRQMIAMLLFQVLVTIICTTPFTAINFYSVINENIEISSLSPSATALYNFFSNVCRLLTYFNSVIGFYIYTLASRTFRIEIKHISERFLVITGFIRYSPGNVQRDLFKQEQTLTNNQPKSVRKTSVIIVPGKNANRPRKN